MSDGASITVRTTIGRRGPLWIVTIRVGDGKGWAEMKLEAPSKASAKRMAADIAANLRSETARIN